MQLLFRSQIWFLDCTFKTAPTIFFQLFTIIGSVKQIYNGVENTVSLPFVYAVLDCKEKIAYTKVIEVTMSAARRFSINIQYSLEEKKENNVIEYL